MSVIAATLQASIVYASMCKLWVHGVAWCADMHIEVYIDWSIWTCMQTMHTEVTCIAMCAYARNEQAVGVSFWRVLRIMQETKQAAPLSTHGHCCA